MNEKYLEYALEYLARELEIIDSGKYVLDEESGSWVEEFGPDFQQGVHDNPFYRSQVAKDILDIKNLLGR